MHVGWFKPKAKPDQPIEFWLILNENINVGIMGNKVEFPWIGRTCLYKGTATDLKFTNHRMPHGCDNNDPWVIVSFGFPSRSKKADNHVEHFSRSEFLEKFVDVPLLPQDTFFKSYEAYLGEINSHLDNLKKIFHIP